ASSAAHARPTIPAPITAISAPPPVMSGGGLQFRAFLPIRGPAVLVPPGLRPPQGRAAMDRIRLGAAVLLLTCVPVRGLCGGARIADVRVGQHGDYARIVVELQAEGEVGVHWVGDDSGAEIFEIAARPLMARQLFTTARPHVGEMLLLAA